jgi:ferric-dicitrate binding protein FerR (iron transport regulator)
MHKENERIKQLLIRYVTGSINRRELDALLDYLVQNPENAEIDEFMRTLLEEISLEKEKTVDSENLYLRITQDARFHQQTSRASFLKRYWLPNAAAILLIIGMGVLYLSHFRRNKQDGMVLSSVRMTMPITMDEQTSPMLRLADGTIINLDSAASGLLVSHEHMQIILQGTELHYKGNTNEAVDNSATNTIVTPKGRQYQLSLSDGTKIWLNAGTSLTYPVHFDDDARVVEVHGEAYFEVQKAKSWPFFVKTSLQQIEVLGTHFNVSAYDEDRFTKTTLVEGSLQVSPSKAETASRLSIPFFSKNTTILVPGQQALMDQERKDIRVDQVDPKEIISWRENIFVFNNEEIKEVMKKVSRWYVVEVIYQEGMEGKRIGGTIPRFEAVEKLMDALKETGLLNYKMEGGRIVIMK